MADKYSISTGGSMQSSSINDSRRMFNFGERVAELAPEQSPFFTYLSKVAKKPTDDPVFKFLEQRYQWQRRNFQVKTEEISPTAYSSNADWDHAAGGTEVLEVECLYDNYGREVSTAVAPNFLLQDQLIQVQVKYASNGSSYATAVYHATFKIAGAPVVSASKADLALTFIDLSLPGTGAITPASNSKIKMEAGAKAQVIGSAFAEGSTDPAGWKDEMYDREGYVQIFKTAIPMFSGTAMATRYRGKADEYKRVWQTKLMEHKMDIEHAMLFGIGSDDSSTGGPVRRSWGIVPYTERYGKIKSFTYADSTYDDFLTAMEDVFAPETGNSGNKLVLASRKIISYFNKLGGDSFLGNTVALGQVSAGTPSNSYGSNGYKLDVQNVQGAFGHNVSVVNTIYGNLNLVAEPLFRGMYEDYAIMIDLPNVAYRPLAGNGVNRDTHIITNVQNNNEDGRKDIVMTEAGLEISLPETHTILKFS
tara:strand:- start:259 stop:1689 length:1431 start_codon:yes stop_codon:yes gene_type:complete